MSSEKAEAPKRGTHVELRLRFLLIFALLFPLVFFSAMPSSIWVIAAFWFSMTVLLSVWLLSAWMARSRRANDETEARVLFEEEQPEVVRQIMSVERATEKGGVTIFQGRLREPAETAYEKLKRSFSARTVPMLQQDERRDTAVVLVPKKVGQALVDRPVQPWKHWILFLLTLITTTWAGAVHQGVNLLVEPGRFEVGLPYALGLLSILGVHEMGHYLAARRHGMNVTPPYFIPVPFALGTFGAFIQMRSPPEDRRALFDVAVAGPLAGLAVAIPALWLGLRSSTVLTLPMEFGAPSVGGTSLGSSMLFVLMSKWSLAEQLQLGNAIQLSPLAFAGWLGLLVTALNLLPIGQLDGGHIARALFGDRVGNIISTVTMWLLLALAVFVWPGLMVWALIVFFVARRGVPPLNDMTRLTPGRRWLGYFTFAILVLILLPSPSAIWHAAKMHYPYL